MKYATRVHYKHTRQNHSTHPPALLPLKLRDKSICTFSGRLVSNFVRWAALRSRRLTKSQAGRRPAIVAFHPRPDMVPTRGVLLVALVAAAAGEYRSLVSSAVSGRLARPQLTARATTGGPCTRHIPPSLSRCDLGRLDGDWNQLGSMT